MPSGGEKWHVARVGAKTNGWHGVARLAGRRACNSVNKDCGGWELEGVEWEGVDRCLPSFPLSPLSLPFFTPLSRRQVCRTRGPRNKRRKYAIGLRGRHRVSFAPDFSFVINHRRRTLPHGLPRHQCRQEAKTPSANFVVSSCIVMKQNISLYDVFGHLLFFDFFDLSYRQWLKRSVRK